ncbi:MAG: tetratricopeptide repeat protein, partial [Gammaproteobacteria bacterium]
IQPDLMAVRAREGIVKLLCHSGELLPTVVVLNDLHWIDERSERVLSYVLENAVCRGVLFLCTYRQRYTPGWDSLPQVRRLDLKPLPEEAAATLFSRLAGAEAGVSSELIARSGGNPYFIQELAHMAGQSSPKSNESDNVPLSLNGLLQERIDRLSPAALDLIRTASAIGHRFDIEDLAQPGSARDAAMAELLDRGYVIADPQRSGLCRFSHSLLQAAVYDGMVRDDLVRVHGRIANHIETLGKPNVSGRCEELARHMEIAGENLKAARYAYLSGHKANAVFALKDAAHWFETALRLLPDTLFEDDARMRRQAMAELIYVRCWNADFDDMVSLADAALAELDPSDVTPETAQFRSWTAEAYIHTFRLHEAETILHTLLEADKDTLPDETRVLALAQYGWLCSLKPATEESSSETRRLAKLAHLTARADADPFPQFMLTYAHAAREMHRGAYSRAMAHADALIALGADRGYPPATCWGHCFRAFIAADAGNESDVMPHFDAATDSALSRFDQLGVDLCRGAALHRLDRLAESLELLETLRRRVPEVGAFHFSHLALAAQGHGRMLRGQAGGAEILRANAKKSSAKGYECGAAVLLAHLGDALLRTGEPDRAVDVLQDAHDRAERLGMIRVQAETLAGLGMCLAQGGDQHAAARAFSKSLELARITDWFPLERRLRQMQHESARI